MKKFLMLAVTLIIMTSSVYAGPISDILNDKPFYEQYAQVYKAGKYEVPKDIPKGEYFVFAQPGKIAKIMQYQKNSNSGLYKESDIYFNYVDYNDYVELDSLESISVENGVLVPVENVDKLDITKNGVFRVGTDIPAGDYWLRLDQDYQTGMYATKSKYNKFYSYDADYTGVLYIDVYTNAGVGDRKIELKNGRLFYKSGIDIYSDKYGEKGELLYDHKKSDIQNEDLDKNLDFSAIRDTYRQKAVNDFITLNKERNELLSIDRPAWVKVNRNKYNEQYLKNICTELMNSAQNESEKKFAEMMINIYFHYNYSINDSIAIMNVKSQQTLDKVLLNYGKYKINENTFLKAVKTMGSAKNFDECQDAVNEILFMYNGTRIGYFDMTNVSDIYKLVYKK